MALKHFAARHFGAKHFAQAGFAGAVAAAVQDFIIFARRLCRR
jgi:hypothetical protein